MTYSIVARDKETGALGVAVQSHFFGVGRLCPFVRAGVGAVATQASVDPNYGPRGLKRMEDGESPEDALTALVAEDPGQASRQVAMVDAEGRVAAHTGTSTIAEASHVIGDQFSVQANMMLKPTVPAAMAEAFQSSSGDFVDRILAALDAAEVEGGDIRGKQSAALLVTGGTRGGEPGADRIWDLRVDDHSEPLAELRRLATIKRGYDLGFMRPDASFEDIDQALLQIEDATGGNPEMTYWAAIALTSMGRLDDGRRLLARARQVSPHWDELLRRLPAAGNAPQQIVDLLLGEVRP